jgi:hypothetical protein
MHTVDDEELPAEGQDHHAVNPTTRVPAITVRAGQARASANPPAFHQSGRAITAPRHAVDAGIPNDVASAAAQIPLAFPALSQNPPSITPGRVGDPDRFVIPDAIRQKFQRRIVHIPLNLLTDAACADQGSDTSSALMELVHHDSVTGRMINIEKSVSHTEELRMTFAEWHEAWKRLLQLHKELRPEEYSYWQAHYRIISDVRGVTGPNWTVWLAYDAEIRKRRLSEDLDPSIFHEAIWHRFYIDNMPNRIVDVTRPIQAQQDLAASRQVRSMSSSSASPSRQSSQQSRSTNRRGHPYQDRPRNSFRLCIVCGNDNHKSFDCFAKKRVDGRDLFLLKASTGFWGDSAGRRICFRYNSAGGRVCRINPCPQGDHKCTLCGSPSHGAQKCPVLAFTE